MTIDLSAMRAAAEAAIKKYGGYPVTDPAFVIALMDRLEAAEKNAARYQWLAWKSDTNQIMPYDSGKDRFYFGHECDAVIDAAMKGMK